MFEIRRLSSFGRKETDTKQTQKNAKCHQRSFLGHTHESPPAAAAAFSGICCPDLGDAVGCCCHRSPCSL
jgi:hypothetical protein